MNEKTRTGLKRTKMIETRYTSCDCDIMMRSIIFVTKRSYTRYQNNDNKELVTFNLLSIVYANR